MNSISHSSELREVGGHSLRWHRWHNEETELKGSFFLLHGQGDYSERYQELAQFFLQEGIALIACDLPGHGLSPGKRGHIPSWEIARQVTEEGLAEGRAAAPGCPVGLGGHSMGGLLVLFLLGELEKGPDFSWISSPLLKPEAGQPNWKPLLLRPLSHLLPKLTIATGVSSDLCRAPSEKEERPEHLSQFHSRLSLHWGRILLELSEVVRTQPERIPPKLPLLLTQGLSDQICPSQYCEEFVARLPGDGVQLNLYPDARHEPFADECKGQLFSDFQTWLEKIVPAGA